MLDLTSNPEATLGWVMGIIIAPFVFFGLRWSRNKGFAKLERRSAELRSQHINSIFLYYDVGLRFSGHSTQDPFLGVGGLIYIADNSLVSEFVQIGTINQTGKCQPNEAAIKTQVLRTSLMRKYPGYVIDSAGFNSRIIIVSADLMDSRSMKRAMWLGDKTSIETASQVFETKLKEHGFQVSA